MRSTYWEATTVTPIPLINRPKDGGILIIGSGLAGVSVAYFLYQAGIECQIVDCGGENASYYRNAGHMLHGTGESYKAMVDIHGEEKADLIQDVALNFLQEAEETIREEEIDCDFNTNGYYRIPLDSTELEELKTTAKINKHGATWFEDLNLALNTKAIAGLHCDKSRSGHPVKFRNAVLKYSGASIRSYKVVDVTETGGRAVVAYADGTCSTHDAVVIAANAYTPLLHNWTKERQLIEPFKGQVIVSAPLQKETFPLEVPFSMDHGYIYGTFLPDNRLLIGGWRNNVPGSETGSYDLSINGLTERGLKTFVEEHFLFREKLEWDFSWSGIMGSAKGGLPLIGPTDSDIIFACAGFNGYGFGWAHGAAQMCVDIMVGNKLSKGWELFNPKR